MPLEPTDILGLRDLVWQRLGILPVDRFDAIEALTEESREDLCGNLWLPLVLTARGLLYGEIIAQIAESATNLTDLYAQPLHIADVLRQPIYQLGRNLLDWIAVRPGVYLIQFGLKVDPEKKSESPQIFFDRLIPFPDLPAIASVGTQQPNLFECHKLCLAGQPIHDLIVESNRYFVLGADGSVIVS
jgi:hypothetical protein